MTDMAGVDALLERAAELLSGGSIDEAECLYRAVLCDDPENVTALHYLGAICCQSQRHGEALTYLEHAARLRPDRNDVQHSLGVAHLVAGNMDTAEAAFRKCVEQEPNDCESRRSLAAVLERSGRRREAAEAYAAAAEQEPHDADAQLRAGRALLACNQPAEARPFLARASELRPDDTQTKLCLGAALLESWHPAAAIACVAPLTTAADDRVAASAHFYTGLAHSRIGNSETAVAQLERSVSLQPDVAAHSALLRAMHYVAGADEAAIERAHRAWAELYLPAARPARRTSRIAGPKRIGFVSRLFGQHASILFGFVSPHGTEFRTYCYADKFESGTEPAQAIRTVCENWRDTTALTNDELRELIAEDGIDLLVNCDGQFTAERLALFTAAPQVKASLLLYPSRTGLAQVDYQISDALIDAPGCEDANCRSEKLIRLPTFVCFRPPANAPETAPPPLLGTGRITFGSFSVPCKINAAVARVWSAILREIPDSKLILHSYVPGSGDSNEMMPDIRNRLLDLFAANGIDCGRIETIGYLPLREHLELYQRVDVALDPFPYHGFMTTLHALWMGVPVVTLPGTRRVSRTGLSFLTHAGVPELIARTEQEYIEIAVTAARDGRALARLRASLRDRVRSSALCDTAAFRASVREAVNTMLAHADS